LFFRALLKRALKLGRFSRNPPGRELRVKPLLDD